MDLRIINFPDKDFKKYLVDTFDKDGDGEISLTEALTITKVLCSRKGIKSIAGIEYLPNLEVLDCSKNAIENIDISENKNLKYLNCCTNPIHSLNIKNNPTLTMLYCGNCYINELDCSLNKNLEILSCRFNPLKKINLQENKKLTILRVRRCQLEKLELYNLKALQVLDCSENKLYELRLHKNEELIHLNCSYNDLYGDLYVGNNLNLKYLECYGNKNLESITISEEQHIEKIYSKIIPTTNSYRRYLQWREYQEEKMNDADYWSEFYEDEQAYYDGWSREDVESGLADAYENDLDARWNTD